jgi:glucose-1-phosphate cytidylyltransferase
VKVIILAGGLGTRLAEETSKVPKPMVTIGGRPLLWHIMKIYAHQGYRDFVLCLGYKADVVKEWLLNLDRFGGSFELDLETGRLESLGPRHREPWRVTALDTGLETQTGGRIRRAFEVIGDDTAMVTYGDGVADINLAQLVSFHKSHGRLATVSAVRPPARFGRLHLDGDQVTRFGEKLQSEEGWINGGFFVLQREAVAGVADDHTYWEKEPLSGLAQAGELMAFRHHGFWQPMDTLRERQELESLWETGQAPWAIWAGADHLDRIS